MGRQRQHRYNPRIFGKSGFARWHLFVLNTSFRQPNLYENADHFKVSDLLNSSIYFKSINPRQRLLGIYGLNCCNFNPCEPFSWFDKVATYYSLKISSIIYIVNICLSVCCKNIFTVCIKLLSNHLCEGHVYRLFYDLVLHSRQPLLGMHIWVRD